MITLRPCTVVVAPSDTSGKHVTGPVGPERRHVPAQPLHPLSLHACYAYCTVKALLRPTLGPSVTCTALASRSTPRCMEARPSEPNCSSFAAKPRHCCVWRASCNAQTDNNGHAQRLTGCQHAGWLRRANAYPDVVVVSSVS
jgi:hypothetical protein